MLIQNASAVSHKQHCFLRALICRIASRRGGKRAVKAVAHRVLVIAYCIIRDGTVYHNSAEIITTEPLKNTFSASPSNLEVVGKAGNRSVGYSHAVVALGL
jgi:hypothetical protein